MLELDLSGAANVFAVVIVFYSLLLYHIWIRKANISHQRKKKSEKMRNMEDIFYQRVFTEQEKIKYIDNIRNYFRYSQKTQTIFSQ